MTTSSDTDEHEVLRTLWRGRLIDLGNTTIATSPHTAVAHIWSDWNVVATGGGYVHWRTYLLHRNNTWVHIELDVTPDLPDPPDTDDYFDRFTDWADAGPTDRRNHLYSAITDARIHTDPYDLILALRAVTAAETAHTLLTLVPGDHPHRFLTAMNPDLTAAIDDYRYQTTKQALNPMRIHYNPYTNQTPVPATVLTTLPDEHA